MKPANFPGRKNDRRKAALDRMTPPPKDISHHDMGMHPYSRLAARILSDAVARSIRTKIDRSATGKLRP